MTPAQQEKWQTAIAYAQKVALPQLFVSTDIILAVEADRAALLELLRKVLDTREREAKAFLSWHNASENFSDSAAENKDHERAMVAASNAESEAREAIARVEGGK